ncbi:hypothetical protein AB0903_31375 [Streptomyces sp. NPDC048389]|uniref:hypothetical protein n=1 Tax=Streptomyces sp. NPDC048389 TaxID=3154622 RepID=UPI0034517C29
MADERYEWLDRDAAERLLRGAPVEAVGDRARTDAARLAAALETAADPGYRHDDGELPGEAAAMAAYRKARADAAASGVAAGPEPETATGGVATGASLGTVRVTKAARPGPLDRLRRGPGLGRPLRFGIATALAGCAIGGVAVAAGSGVLPTFGEDRPTPASSVSAAATPGPATSPPQGGAGTVRPSGSPGETGTPLVVPPVPGSTSPSPGDAGGTAAGLPADDGAATAGSDGSPARRELYRKTVEACRDYRSGRIARDTRLRLEEAAKGPARVERFCARLLDGGFGDGSTGSGDSAGADGSEGASGGPGRNGEGDGPASGGKNSGGSGGSGGDRDADGVVLQQAPDGSTVSWPLVDEPTAAAPSPTTAPVPSSDLSTQRS